MRTDRLTVQMVVGFIGISGVLIICGLIGLAYLGREIPEPLSTLGGAAIGALGTLLARTSTDFEHPGESNQPADGKKLLTQTTTTTEIGEAAEVEEKKGSAKGARQ